MNIPATTSLAQSPSRETLEQRSMGASRPSGRTGIGSGRQRRRKNLKTISGIRALATLWIVLGHFQDTAFRHNRDETFLLVLNRGYVAVGIYIVLSGFITHYAYKNRRYDHWTTYVSFYFRRIGRVVFTYLASCVLGLVDPLFTRHDALASEYPVQASATVFLVQAWFEIPSANAWSRDIPSQPNPGGWTISTLLFAWLLYPFLNKAMFLFSSKTNNSLRAKMALVSVLYVFAMLPCVVFFLSQDGIITNQQFEFLYKFPPCRIFDFCIGMVVAELVEHPKANTSFMCKVMPDLATVAFSIFMIIGDINYQDLSDVPENVEQPLIRENGETFLISGFAPIMAVMLLGYSINSGDSSVKYSLTSMLEHPITERLGSFSFAIYCFQYTFFFMVEQIQYNRTGITSSALKPGFGEVEVPAKLIAAYLMPYLCLLVGFSAFWTIWLERPFAVMLAKYCKRKFERVAKTPASATRSGNGGGTPRLARTKVAANTYQRTLAISVNQPLSGNGDVIRQQYSYGGGTDGTNSDGEDNYLSFPTVAGNNTSLPSASDFNHDGSRSLSRVSTFSSYGDIDGTAQEIDHSDRGSDLSDFDDADDIDDFQSARNDFWTATRAARAKGSAAPRSSWDIQSWTMLRACKGAVAAVVMTAMVLLAEPHSSRGLLAPSDQEPGVRALHGSDLFADPLDAVLEIGPKWLAQHDRVVQGDAHLVMINFYSGSCGHCQVFKAVWDKVAQYAKDARCNIRVLALNCDNFRDVCTRYEVTSTPKIMGFGPGSNAAQPETGVVLSEDKHELLRWMSEVDKSFQAPGSVADAAEPIGEALTPEATEGELERIAPASSGTELSPKELLKRDAASAVRFGLETGVFLGRTFVDGEALAALYRWLNVLRRSFPGEQERAQLQDLLNSCMALEKASHAKRIDSEKFDAVLAKWKFAVYHKHQDTNWRAEWTLCRPRSVRDLGVTGGYPCALWSLLHILTVSSASGGSSPEHTLRAIHGYIKFFFSCNECRENFVQSNPDPVRDVLARATGTGIPASRALVIWLWAEHNAVTKRLNSEMEEDALARPGSRRRRARTPHKIFPTVDQCRSCRRAQGGSSGRLRGDAALPRQKDAVYLRQEQSQGPNAKFRGVFFSPGKGVPSASGRGEPPAADDDNDTTATNDHDNSNSWDYDVLHKMLLHTYCFDDSVLHCPSRSKSSSWLGFANPFATARADPLGPQPGAAASEHLWSAAFLLLVAAALLRKPCKIALHRLRFRLKAH
ncbi:Sulfhydryl oxidase 1 (mSOx) (Quiescin Q6) (Skin sulfhydryl oxidase) [Durusdinium trenchii]|uniref:Sulfhydryl oxidase n=1 Tax=Durusdinium trenchii TaxID=1381693 RepID=A0ABP0I6M5_9DINO